MADTKFVLAEAKVDGETKPLVACSDGNHTTVSFKGKEMTLNAALTSILAELSRQNADNTVDAKISAAISKLIGGAPETYDTLKEIADYIEAHKEVTEALKEAINAKQTVEFATDSEVKDMFKI